MRTEGTGRPAPAHPTPGSGGVGGTPVIGARANGDGGVMTGTKGTSPEVDGSAMGAGKPTAEGLDGVASGKAPP